MNHAFQVLLDGRRRCEYDKANHIKGIYHWQTCDRIFRNEHRQEIREQSLEIQEMWASNDKNPVTTPEDCPALSGPEDELTASNSEEPKVSRDEEEPRMPETEETLSEANEDESSGSRGVCRIPESETDESSSDANQDESSGRKTESTPPLAAAEYRPEVPVKTYRKDGRDKTRPADPVKIVSSAVARTWGGVVHYWIIIRGATAYYGEQVVSYVESLFGLKIEEVET